MFADMDPPTLGKNRSPKDTMLAQVIDRLSYDLNAVIAGDSMVPKVFLVSLPADMATLTDASLRKLVFLKSILPLILKVNNEILIERKRLLELKKKIDNGKSLNAVDRLWLVMISERYKTHRDNISLLLKRLDIVPPSLALAQAATESGWGTSRFTIAGNALFGEWTYAEGNLVPESREDGKEHMIKKFSSLSDSIRSYLLNLNTHRAYREFRELRAKLRKIGAPLEGIVLVDKLHRYSERGIAYVREIRGLIKFNKLDFLDNARLDSNIKSST